MDSDAAGSAAMPRSAVMPVGRGSSVTAFSFEGLWDRPVGDSDSARQCLGHFHARLLFFARTDPTQTWAHSRTERPVPIRVTVFCSLAWDQVESPLHHVFGPLKIEGLLSSSACSHAIKLPHVSAKQCGCVIIIRMLRANRVDSELAPMTKGGKRVAKEIHNPRNLVTNPNQLSI